MDKPDGAKEKTDADAAWGTLEELLLACAVDRHGTDSWDSVAIEIQKRSSNPTFHHLFTPHHCKQRFQDLQRRYAPKHTASNSDDDDDDDKTVRWLEELRKLRVAELRRELDRYDLSIVSLQRKVKRLKEEQEEDLGEDGEEKSDPAGREQELDKRQGTESEPDVSPESDRDNQSVNESNSTDPKGEEIKTRADDSEPAGAKEAEPVQSGLSKKTVRDDSCNGSSVDRNRNSVKAEQEAVASESPEVWESDGGGEEEEEGTSSDMQSSASRIRKKGEEADKAGSGSVSGEERENEDQSVAVKRLLSRKSQPYVDILEMVRAHKLGSVFERRLESQDTPEYRKLIRQHMDFETISTKHKEGQYSGCYRKLYRDLLLLFNNAILFFGKKSKEYAAATELLDLVSKEVSQRKLKLNPSAEEPPPPVAARPLSPKAEIEPSDSLIRKPNISGPIIVCRKRSSIAGKGSRSSSGADTKREPKTALLEEKAKFDWNEPSKSSGSGEEHRITKKRSKDRFPPSSSSLKKNSENVTKPNPKPNPEKDSEEVAPIQNPVKGAGGSSSSKHQKPKADNAATVSGAKKKSAADFLNRMKQNSSPNKGPVVDTTKNSGVSSKNKGGSSEQKKSGGGGGGKGEEVKTDQASRRGSTAKTVKEQGSPTKRSAGRPPKRAAAPVPASAPVVTGKRNRERVDDVKTVASKQQPKKRTRK